MFKEKVFELLDLNLSKVVLKDDSISYKNILDSNIHPAIKNYIKAEIKLFFSRDKSVIKKKSVFNYESSKIDFLFSQIFDELIKITKLTSEELNNLFLQAISFNLSHLIKPNWSLKKLIFNDKKSVSKNDFLFLIDYAYFFPYQKSILIKYFNKLNNNSIDVEKFDDVIIKIDKKLFDENKQGILLDFFNSCSDFINNSKEEHLSIDPILAFLTNKNLESDLAKLKNYIDNNQIIKVTFNELQKVLIDKDDKDESIQSAVVVDSDENENIFSEEENSELINPHSASDNKDKIKTKSVEIGENLSLFDEEEFNSKQDDSLIKKDNGLTIPLSLDNLNSTSENQPAKQKRTAADLFEFLTRKEINRIQDNLFNSDSEDFIIVIEKLISSDSYADSLIVLDKIVKSYQMNESSKELFTLKLALQKFFESS